MSSARARGPVAPLALVAVDVKAALRQVLELTRARWSDMAQQRGAVIETRMESDGDPAIMAIEMKKASVMPGRRPRPVRSMTGF